MTILPDHELIKQYNDGASLRDLAKKYGTDHGVIKRKLIKLNVKLRSILEANRTYSFDENIFNKIDTYEKAYWLGFIASDGSVYGNSLKIGLSFKDFAHLEKFRIFLNSNHPIHTYYPIVKGKTYKSCELSVRSDIMINDLLNLNIGNKKSTTLQPPILKDKYLGSYILGIVDGDGCFSVDKLGQIRLNIISSLAMCQFIMDTLVKHCDITPTKIVEEKRSPGMNYCYFGGNNKIKSIVDFLYKDVQVCLDRKQSIVKEHFKEKLQ